MPDVRESRQWTRDVIRVGQKLGLIGHKWDKTVDFLRSVSLHFGSAGTNLGLFKISFNTFWLSALKHSPDLSRLGPTPTSLKPTPPTLHFWHGGVFPQRQECPNMAIWHQKRQFWYPCRDEPMSDLLDRLIKRPGHSTCKLDYWIIQLTSNQSDPLIKWHHCRWDL